MSTKLRREVMSVHPQSKYGLVDLLFITNKRSFKCPQKLYSADRRTFSKEAINYVRTTQTTPKAFSVFLAVDNEILLTLQEQMCIGACRTGYRNRRNFRTIFNFVYFIHFMSIRKLVVSENYVCTHVLRGMIMWHCPRWTEFLAYKSSRTPGMIMWHCPRWTEFLAYESSRTPGMIMWHCPRWTEFLAYESSRTPGMIMWHCPRWTEFLAYESSRTPAYRIFMCTKISANTVIEKIKTI